MKTLSQIYKVSTLTADRRIEEVLSCIMHDIKHNLGFDRAGFFLLDEEKRFLEIKSSIGFSPSEEQRARSKPLDVRKHDCFHTKVVRTGKEMIIDDTENDPNTTIVDRKINRIYDRRCAFYFPLKIENELIGVLGLSSNKQGLSLTANDLELIRIFVNQASVAFENARLYERLLSEKKFAENILQSSANGMLTMDINGFILSMNPAAKSILGVLSQGAIESSVENLIPELSKQLPNIYHKLNEGEVVKDLEINYRNGKNQDKVLKLSATKLRSEKIPLPDILITLEDLTEKKMKEEYLSRMEKMASLGYLAAGLAHEVRNPLTSISLDLDWLFEKFFSNPEIKELLKKILREIDRLDRLVSQLLEFARISPPEFKRFDLNATVRETCNLVQRKCTESGIKIRTNLHSTISELYGDSEKIKEGLLNILLNAIQAMPRGGLLTVKTRLLETSQKKRFGFWKNGKRIIEISIKDTGTGINENNLPKVFYPFFTTKPMGTGLGLSVANSIIEEHNGIILVESVEGRGSTFRIQLPAMQS